MNLPTVFSSPLDEAAQRERTVRFKESTPINCRPFLSPEITPGTGCALPIVYEDGPSFGGYGGESPLSPTCTEPFRGLGPGQKQPAWGQDCSTALSEPSEPMYSLATKTAANQSHRVFEVANQPLPPHPTTLVVPPTLPRRGSMQALLSHWEKAPNTSIEEDRRPDTSPVSTLPARFTPLSTEKKSLN